MSHFGLANRVGGSTGCNNFTGTYQDGGNQVTFSPFVVTAAACVSDAGRAQEEAILGALQEPTASESR